MGLCRGDDLSAPGDMSHQADQVAHGPRRHEEGGLLAEQARRTRFEREDSRIIAEDIVADRCIGHGRPHRGGRMRHGVGARVDLRGDRTARGGVRHGATLVADRARLWQRTVEQEAIDGFVGAA